MVWKNCFARYLAMCLTSSYRSIGKAMDIPLFSGKRKLYTVRPIKASEMIELENPTPHPVPVESEHSFATAEPESKSLSQLFIRFYPHFVLSGPGKNESN